MSIGCNEQVANPDGESRKNVTTFEHIVGAEDYFYFTGSVDMDSA
jgi:hypothetical protein